MQKVLSHLTSMVSFRLANGCSAVIGMSFCKTIKLRTFRCQCRADHPEFPCANDRKLTVAVFRAANVCDHCLIGHGRLRHMASGGYRESKFQ